MPTKKIKPKRKSYFEIEPFTDEEYASLMNNKKIQEYLIELDKILSDKEKLENSNKRKT